MEVPSPDSISGVTSSWLGWTAVGIAVLVGLLVAWMTPPAAKSHNDPSMVWEGRVAQGFGLMLFAGPLILVQLGFTIAATVSGTGSLWLWVLVFAAPLLGLSAPIRWVVNRLRRILFRVRA